MNDESRPILILFMGERTEHAELSIEYFYPASVHIITSDKFEQKYEDSLSDWSEKYDFRRGKVCAIDDLFTPHAIDSLLFSAFSALNDEVENTGEIGRRRSVLIGITGGTMHMAAAGTYLGQLIGGSPFYVIKPPEGQSPVPRRDITLLPALRGLAFAKRTNVEDIDYILTKGTGSLEEFFSDTRLEEGFLRTAYDLSLIYVDSEKGTWWLTPIGYSSFSFITKSKIWGQFGHMLSLISENKSEDVFDPSVG